MMVMVMLMMATTMMMMMMLMAEPSHRRLSTTVSFIGQISACMIQLVNSIKHRKEPFKDVIGICADSN